MTDKGDIEWTAKESYLVKLDARNSNFVAVADSGLVPQVGDRGSFGSYRLRVHTRTFSYYKNNPTMCHVDVQYVGKQGNKEETENEKNNEKKPDDDAEDPTSWQKMTITTEQRQTLLTDHGVEGTLGEKNRDGTTQGVPATNTATDPIDGLTEDRALVKMVYADAQVAAPNFKALLSYVNKINSDIKFLGGDERTIRCMGFSAEYDQLAFVWSVSLEFLYDPKEHMVPCYNAGFNELVGGKRKAIMTDDGLAPVSKPVMLKQNGEVMPIADAADPNNLILLKFYPYQIKEFKNIWDDCGLNDPPVTGTVD